MMVSGNRDINISHFASSPLGISLERRLFKEIALYVFHKHSSIDPKSSNLFSKVMLTFPRAS